MRLPGIVFLLLCCAAMQATAQVCPVQTLPAQQPSLAPEVRAALGIDPLLDQLHTLQDHGQGSSLEALTVRQQVLERLMAASFDVDAALGRINTEASYAGEDRYVLQVHNQRQANALNLITFAASGALGAAGSAMQLTHDLNHAGTALQAAAGGTSVVLSAVQLKSAGGKQPLRSPYNMLAEVLDKEPNPESHYPPLVLAYLRAPRPDGRPSIAGGLITAWRRLDRLKETPKGNGPPSPISSPTAPQKSSSPVTNLPIVRPCSTISTPISFCSAPASSGPFN